MKLCHFVCISCTRFAKCWLRQNYCDFCTFLCLLCRFLRMEDLPVVRLKLLWTMNWTWTDPVTVGPPSAGQRVTRAACNRPQLSFPIRMFLLRKTNEKSLTSQPVCNVERRKGFRGILSATGLIRDGKLRFENSFSCAFANISQSELLLCHVASVMRYLGLGFKHGSVIWWGWWTTDELWTLFALCERVCVSYEC